MKKLFLLYVYVSICATSVAQTDTQVYPTHWWVGMKNPQLQLMLHGKNIGNATYSVNYPGIVLRKVHKAENPNYVFLDLTIGAAAKREL